MLKVQSSQFILPKAKDTTGDDVCDFIILDNSVLVAVLCDGVGSARKGGDAARQRVEVFIDYFTTRSKNWDVLESFTLFVTQPNRVTFKESST